MGLEDDRQHVGADVAEITALEEPLEFRVAHVRGTVEQLEWRTSKLDLDLGQFLRQSLSMTQQERHTLPAPVVDLGAQRDVGLGLRFRLDARFVQITQQRFAIDVRRLVLPANMGPLPIAEIRAAYGAPDFDLLVPDRFGREFRRRLHRDERKNLEHVILDHVAKGTGPVVVRAAPVFDTDRLRDGNLDELDVVTVPERLEDRVVEAKAENVLDRLLSEVVIDAIDLVFAQRPVEVAVQRQGALEVMAEGLLDHDASVRDLVPVIRIEHADLVERGNRDREQVRFE